jgi:alkylhydroperoxidase family enzyme
MAEAMAVDSGVGLEKLQRLAEYPTDPIFDERERAALDYVSEATHRCQVADATFERLQRHFDDREIVEITFVNAAENFYNLFGGPLQIESDGLCAIALERRGLSSDGGGAPLRAPAAVDAMSPDR